MSRSDALVLPHSAEAERYVLGAILKQPDLLENVLPVMGDGQKFYSPKHRIIYDAMLRLYNKRDPVDIVSLTQSLQQAGDLERVGGRVFIIELAENMASTANAVHHAGTIISMAKLRDVIHRCSDVISQAYEQIDCQTVIDNFRKSAFDVGVSKDDTNFVKIGDFNDEFLRRVDDYQTGEYWKHSLETGFSGLDDTILGMPYGGLVTIAARTSHGKTQLATQIATNVSRAGTPTAFVSLEMNKLTISERIHCYDAMIDSQRLKRKGMLSDEENDKLYRATTRTKDYPLYISDNPSVNPDQLLSSLRKLMIIQPTLKLLIVDYLQLMDFPALKKVNRQEIVSTITRGLKVLATELDIVVIQLSQLNREGARENRRPTLAELRESGSIEQDSDIVIFPWHEDVSPSGPKWLIVGKNREGMAGPKIPMSFKFGQWAEIIEREE